MICCLSHYNRAVNMPCPHHVFMQKLFAADLKMKAQGTCSQCSTKGNLWACLQDCCSYVGCGHCNKNHIELHNQETDHHLCINLQSYSIWCFTCKATVDTVNTPTPTELEVHEDKEKHSRRTHHDILDEDDFLEIEQGLKPRGLCGLTNIGNTCYMNAALQALSNCPPLTQYFLECNAMIPDSKHPSVSTNFYQIVNEIWSRKRPKSIVPSQLLRSVRSINSQFRGYGQQDAQEFLRCIMDRLHEELKQPVMTYCSSSSCNTSGETNEPSHQAKRLLGGQSVEQSNDLQMSHESIDDQHKPLDRRRSSAILDTSDVQIDIEMGDGDGDDDDDDVQHSSRVASSTSSYTNGDCTDSTEDMDTCESFNDKAPESAANVRGGAVIDTSQKEVIKKTSDCRSIITDLFDGKVQSSVQCLTCNRVSSKIETFQDLSLPIPGKDELAMIHATQCSPLVSCSRRDEMYDQKGWMMSIFDWLKRWFFGPQVTLQDCLSAFFSADELKGDNMYSCEKCKKLRNGIKLCKVLQLPEILCVHLKRFRHEMYFSSKISHFISFPLSSLDMKPFIVKDFKCSNTHKAATTYDLVAIISHHGSVGAGHYVAFAKNYINNKWFEYNDSWVGEVSESFISTVEAYVLFYRKVSDEASKERQWLFNMMRHPEPCVKCYYVSKYWFTKFQTCAEPGPVTNSDFVCLHGDGVHPKNHGRIKDLVTAIPEVVWTHIYNRYGGGPVVTSLDVCELCKKLVEERERRKEYEMENFKTLNQQYPAAENVDVYCISMKWFRQWEAFVKNQDEDPPGPIDNRNIIVTKGNAKVLKSNADYGQVSKETWDFLYGIYDGGPVFALEAETDEQEQ